MGDTLVRRLLRWLVYLLASLLGVGAFLYPFFAREAGAEAVGAAASPVFLTVLGGLSLVALLLETQGEATADAKRIALLGVLIGLNAALSFLETALPGPGGFSPVFFLIILGGYVFGHRSGFLLGSLTLFVSALITGGVGPWLPYRMLVAGWIGMTAPFVGLLVRRLRAQARPAEIVILAVFGGLWGLAFGALMNLWFWPFATGAADQHWQVGLGLRETAQRYLAFYVTTSLVWDLARAVGTAAMLVVFGRPTLRTLWRFQRRFEFQVIATVDGAVTGDDAASVAEVHA